MKHTFIIAIILLSFQLALAQHYTWQQLQTEPYKGKQDDIYFINENCGWYVNGFGRIYHTTDGGATWNMQIEQKGTFFRCISFIDSLTGFAGTVGTRYFPGVTDSIPLYKTTDGGRHWLPVVYTGPPVKGLCGMDIVKVQFNNHGEIGYKYHIYATGRVGGPANLMVSDDGGTTFRSMSLGQYADGAYDIKMFNMSEGFICASVDTNAEKSHARVLHTKDGGKTWKVVYESNRPFEITWKCAFPTLQIGYVTVQHYNPDSNVTDQYIIKTTDGGETWQELLLCEDYGARPFGIGFIDTDHGFVGTRNGGYETNDGGKTWDKIDLGRACNKIRIVKTPSGKIYGYAIGVNVFKLKIKKI